MGRGSERRGLRCLWVALVIVLVSGCAVRATPGGASDEAAAPIAPAEGQRLRVVATTSIVGDVVRNVAGDRIEVVQLMPLGADPHAFEPTPQDAAAIGEAQLVFANGAGLEAFMDRLLASAGEDTLVVEVSEGVPLLEYLDDHEDDDDHDDDDHDHEGDDPHVWFDPGNVKVWVTNIEATLRALDPDGASTYRANADAYLSELDALDDWIRAQVATVPEERRKLITDHAVFAYFAQTYGFEQVGVVIAGSSTLSAPSARDLAALQDVIREHGVPAIFVGTTVDPRLSEQVASDTGIDVVRVYTGSLGEPGSPADTYLAFMRHNVTQIVETLSGNGM
jgi:ABC-type Zn uptake system ZnuABC Zn-binding protein ZnuA